MIDSGSRLLTGEMAEWLKAHAWKACIPQGIQGSNPCLSAIASLYLVEINVDVDGERFIPILISVLPNLRWGSAPRLRDCSDSSACSSSSGASQRMMTPNPSAPAELPSNKCGDAPDSAAN